MNSVRDKFSYALRCIMKRKGNEKIIKIKIIRKRCKKYDNYTDDKNTNDDNDHRISNFSFISFVSLSL